MNAAAGKTELVLAFICRHIAEHGHAPTIREIGAACGLASTNGVRYHLGILARAGIVIRDPIVARGMRLAQTPEAKHAVPEV